MRRAIVVPTAVVDRERKLRERIRLNKARYEYTHHKRSHHRQDMSAEYNARKARRIEDKLNTLFIMWDGESPQDSGYSFFANSVGFEILHPYLSTLECFELIIDTALEYPKAVHISYGFNLDVSYICKDLPRRQLSALRNFNKTVWQDWEIEHIPHKWFRLKHGRISVKIYDIHTFFPGGYANALLSFEVGTVEERRRIAAEKARRSEFLWKDIDEIADYCRLELKLGPELGESLRQSFAASGYVPKSWHGPGAIARMAIQRHGIYKCMARTPAPVRIAARYAFAGGRFEQFLAGHAEGKVYEGDINSAYPYYATMLPNLANGKWRKGKSYEHGKFAVYRIAYDADADRNRVFPLFRRMADSSVCWPHTVEGWYWAPEAELVIDDPAATFKEAWIFDEKDNNDKPFAFLADYYRRRKLLASTGNIAAYAYKILINAIFGQLAQRTGWDRRKKLPPKSHQLEWAGYITSACRAEVYRTAIACGPNLVSINTDSVQSLAPLDWLEKGDALGQWKVSEYEDGIFWQSGIYSLREYLGYDERLGYGWTKAKTRGIPKGLYSPEELLECLASNTPLKLNKKVFVTYGLADSGRWNELNTWSLEPHEFIMGGSGKRKHNLGLVKYANFCEEVCSKLPGQLHQLTQWNPEVIYEGRMSKKHYLPWLDGEDTTIGMFDDLCIFDADHLDPDDEWIRAYAV